MAGGRLLPPCSHRFANLTAVAGKCGQLAKEIESDGCRVMAGLEDFLVVVGWFMRRLSRR